MRIALILLLCLSSSLALAQRKLTTITINYASPQSIVEVIRPYLSAESSVQLYQNRLVLNVTDEELTKTQELLEQLDSAGRQLLISVRSDGEATQSGREVDIDTVIRSGNIVISDRQGVNSRSIYGKGKQETDSRTTIRIDDYQSSNADQAQQAVRATEGMAAYISTGMTAPVRSSVIGPDGRRYEQQDYVDAVAGFYATTWVNDGVVRISIDQSNDQLNGQTISTQQLRSQVSGELGEWLPIGTVGDAASQRTQGIGSRAQTSRTSSTQLFIKVELVE